MNTVLLLWAALAAQQPDTAAQAALTRALLAARDSVSAVRRSAGGFNRDLDAASANLVIARSQRVRGACAAAITSAAALDNLLAAAPADHAAAARARLRRTLADLRGALTRCTKDFGPGTGAARADSLRAWGPYRLRELEPALRKYELAAQQFAAAAGVRYSS